MSTTFSLDNGSMVADAIRLLVWTLVAPFVAAFWLVAAMAAHWRPVALCAGTVGAVVLCAAVPLFPVGLGIVAAVGFLTYPRPRVSWNSRKGNEVVEVGS